MVYIRDVADVRDGYNEQTSMVRHDGRKSALVTVLKSGDASTLDIIREVRERLGNVTLPEGLEAVLPVRSVGVRRQCHEAQWSSKA